jgi:hypothetical protein
VTGGQFAAGTWLLCTYYWLMFSPTVSHVWCDSVLPSLQQTCTRDGIHVALLLSTSYTQVLPERKQLRDSQAGPPDAQEPHRSGATAVEEYWHVPVHTIVSAAAVATVRHPVHLSHPETVGVWGQAPCLTYPSLSSTHRQFTGGRFFVHTQKWPEAVVLLAQLSG